METPCGSVPRGRGWTVLGGVNVKQIGELKNLMVELIQDVIKENDGKEGKDNVNFSQRAKEIIKEVADYARTTKIYAANKEQREKFWEETKDATPALIYEYMLDRVVNAPTKMHMNCSVILIIPKLDELLNTTEV